MCFIICSSEPVMKWDKQLILLIISMFLSKKKKNCFSFKILLWLGYISIINLRLFPPMQLYTIRWPRTTATSYFLTVSLHVRLINWSNFRLHLLATFLVSSILSKSKLLIGKKINCIKVRSRIILLYKNNIVTVEVKSFLKQRPEHFTKEDIKN